MKNEFEDYVLKEIDNIYGIEDSKWEILNYVKYLEISKEEHFANYNIIIHNNSSYPSETKNKLIEFLYSMLRKNGIITTKYEFIDAKLIRNFEREKKKEKLNLKKDLIIIDSERIGRSLENYREEITSIMEEFTEKIYIIIDDGFCVGEVNASFNKYFDWFFEIDKISENNKKEYIMNLLEENNIKNEDDCDYLENLVSEPFFKVKSKMNHIILQCKINNITNITNDIAEKYFKDSQTICEKNNTNEEEKNLKKNVNLNSLVGIYNIKEEINKIINYLKICKKRKSNLPMLHMCFTGNPGTGKTSVARIIGQIFKENKILSKGEFVEIHGRDLVGKYVGWTAKEVKNCIKRAKGGILFIDEAYSLVSDRKGSFEDEAIATLIKEMEDNRGDLCVILAGYKEEMMNLIEKNPGFESRIQFYVDFPDYTEEELYKIFKSLVQKENYKISSHVKETLLRNFKEQKTSITFSNGRYVRNIYEKVKIEQANRVANSNSEDINLIKKCDIEGVLKDEKLPENNKIKIGFAI